MIESISVKFNAYIMVADLKLFKNLFFSPNDDILLEFSTNAALLLRLLSVVNVCFKNK